MENGVNRAQKILRFTRGRCARRADQTARAIGRAVQIGMPSGSNRLPSIDHNVREQIEKSIWKVGAAGTAMALAIAIAVGWLGIHSRKTNAPHYRIIPFA